MISTVFLESGNTLLSLDEIYKRISRQWLKYRELKSNSWRNRIDHYLMKNICFEYDSDWNFKMHPESLKLARDGNFDVFDLNWCAKHSHSITSCGESPNSQDVSECSPNSYMSPLPCLCTPGYPCLCTPGYQQHKKRRHSVDVAAAHQEEASMFLNKSICVIEHVSGNAQSAWLHGPGEVEVAASDCHGYEISQIQHASSEEKQPISCETHLESEAVQSDGAIISEEVTCIKPLDLSYTVNSNEESNCYEEQEVQSSGSTDGHSTGTQYGASQHQQHIPLGQQTSDSSRRWRQDRGIWSPLDV